MPSCTVHGIGTRALGGVTLLRSLASCFSHLSRHPFSFLLRLFIFLSLLFLYLTYSSLDNLVSLLALVPEIHLFQLPACSDIISTLLLTMPSQAALLIGSITHARKEWEAFSSILTLKVGPAESWQPNCLCAEYRQYVYKKNMADKRIRSTIGISGRNPG